MTISFLNDPRLILFLLIALAVFAILTLLQRRQIKKIIKRSRDIYGDGKAASLDQALAKIKKHLSKHDKDINEIQDIVTKLYNLANVSLQKVGLVRFNPFEDIGGDQSFSIALLDRKENGIVISSLHSRSGTRVYSKPVKKGESKHPLSDEEKQAIREAVERSKSN